MTLPPVVSTSAVRRENDDNNNNGESAPDRMIPKGLDKNNVLVADSDVRAAVGALLETFRAHEEGRFVPRGGEGAAESDDPQTIEALRKIHKRMLHDRARQMVASLHQLSHTISDDAFNQYVSQHCAEYEPSDAGEDSDVDDDDDDHDHEEENSKNEGNKVRDGRHGKAADNGKEADDECEFDDDELTDRAAKDKVDGLRRQVLERARQVRARRASVVERATELARQATQRLVPPPKEGELGPSDPSVGGNEDAASVNAEKVQLRVTSLRESVAQLKERLASSEQHLERQLERLTSTVAVIEKQGARNPTRRVDELMRTDFHAPVGAPHNDENAMDPAERLAAFLRR